MTGMLIIFRYCYCTTRVFLVLSAIYSNMVISTVVEFHISIFVGNRSYRYCLVHLEPETRFGKNLYAVGGNGSGCSGLLSLELWLHTTDLVCMAQCMYGQLSGLQLFVWGLGHEDAITAPALLVAFRSPRSGGPVRCLPPIGRKDVCL